MSSLNTSQASGPPSRPCMGAASGSVSSDSTTPIGFTFATAPNLRRTPAAPVASGAPT